MKETLKNTGVKSKKGGAVPHVITNEEIKKQKPLTHKQKMFVSEFLVDMNATNAAIRAGYKPKRAYAMGSENLRKPEIASALYIAQSERLKKTSVSAEQVIENIIRIGNKAEDAEKFGEALKAQELLGKHLVMFTEHSVMDLNLNMIGEFRIELVTP